MSESRNSRTMGEQVFVDWLDSLPAYEPSMKPLDDLDKREAIKQKKIRAAKRKRMRINGGSRKGLADMKSSIFPTQPSK